MVPVFGDLSGLRCTGWTCSAYPLRCIEGFHDSSHVFFLARFPIVVNWISGSWAEGLHAGEFWLRAVPGNREEHVICVISDAHIA